MSLFCTIQRFFFWGFKGGVVVCFCPGNEQCIQKPEQRVRQFLVVLGKAISKPLISATLSERRDRGAHSLLGRYPGLLVSGFPSAPKPLPAMDP